ncbi:MAG: MFS transporter [Tumebacillaceae bacterium]
MNEISAKTHYRILWFVCIAHCINDLAMAIVPALLPIFQKDMNLTYTQLGVIVFVATILASFLQPLIGIYADKKQSPYMLPLGAILVMLGVLGISKAHSYTMVLLMVALIGLGSAVFHPEASRAAHAAAGPRRGLGQSIFQVGGNFGQSLGPLTVAWIFLPFGQGGALGFAAFPLIALALLLIIARWYKANGAQIKKRATEMTGDPRYGALAVLVIITIARSWINSGVGSFLPLYLINEQGKSIETAQYYTFVFLLAGAIGTLLGGMASDRFSKKKILMFSMIGAVPFTLLIPVLDGFWAYANVFLLGLISLSSFAVTVVYGQQLVPNKIGFVSGLMIGFAIGAGGIGATILGKLADSVGIVTVIELLTIFPIFGTILCFWLYDPDKQKRALTPAIETAKTPTA